MSDGKKFALKTPLTSEERLDEIERKYDVIRERIQAYDEVLSQFASLKNEVKQANKNSASLHDFCESLSKEIKTFVSSISSQINALKISQEYHSAAAADHASQLNTLKTKTEQSQKEFKKLSDDVNEKTSKVNEECSRSIQLHSAARAKISDLHYDCAHQSENLNKLYADYFKFKDKCEANDDYLSKDVKRLRELIDDLPDLQEWANKIYSRLQTELAYRDKQAASYTDKKVEAMGQEFAANPLSAESIKSSLFNEIQALGLDGKNAYIKASNCATQIQLFEKKLENLSLLIKKYELNK